MSLDISKLENVRARRNRVTARCPACAEVGHDRRGEHLFVNDEGRFGCVVYPGDSPDAKAHRKRIFSLCGIRDVKTLTVRSVQAKPGDPIKNGLLGRLGRVFETHTAGPSSEGDRRGKNVFHVRESMDCKKGVLSVLKPYRPLTAHEQELLRRKGMENDPLISEALNIFEGRIVG